VLSEQFAPGKGLVVSDPQRRSAAPAPEGVQVTFDSLLAPASRDADQAASIQLWSLLPRELAALFRPRVTDVAAEVLQEINRSIPVYDRPREGSFGKALAFGVQQAIQQFVDRLADPDAPQDDRKALFRNLGRHELVKGRNLDVLQSAYRIGARVAWRRMARLGQQAGIPIGTLGVLAEAVFVYMDELSALSIEGYTTAQAREAGTLERRRRRLLKMLISQPATPAQAIGAAAKAARWSLPEHVFMVAMEPLDARRTPHAPALGDQILVDLEGTAPCLLVPDTHVRDLGELEAGRTGWRSAVGPRTPLPEASRSLQWARGALALVHHGVLDDVPVTWCGDHLLALWLFSDMSLADKLADKVLRPLSALPAAARGRLSQTLLAWLKTRGNAVAMGDLLGLHPQTVRNRMRQLENLFGQRLTDPNDRFEMELALRVLDGRPA
jgi:PucR C-terminal helix-turn-helix domain